MAGIYVDSKLTDEARRGLVYTGNTFMFTPRPAAVALTALAWELIQEAFAPLDPATAQFELPVERFVEIIAPLKTRFTHHERGKKILRDLFEDIGCSTQDTFFDVPKLRIVTHGGYLTAGVGYAYRAHRDTWYACPPSQINWWVPISEVVERNAFVIHPNYFQRQVKNNSDQFDAYRWNADGRKRAAEYITEDPRPHPHLQEPLDLDWQVLVGQPGSIVMFSAQHLHATVPNDSGSTRFSIDFRTVHRADVLAKRGAKLVDSKATGTTLRDFLCADGFGRLPEDVISLYDNSPAPADGVLIFDPNAR
jgi:hypothetical protein